jgi:type III pantothenate kinase
MRYRALHEFTGKLPSVEPSRILPAIAGSSTAASITSGVELAIVLETDAMIEAYGHAFKNLQVLITGGDYSFFENSLKSTIFAVPQLTQLGLHEILRINRS